MVLPWLRRLWRLLPMEARAGMGRSVRGALAHHLARRLPAADPAKRRAAESVDLVGLTGSRLGVGEGARLLQRELEAAGVAVTVCDVTGAIGAPGQPGTGSNPRGAADPLIVALNPDVAVPFLAAANPDLLRNRRVIGFWVWELETLPPAWRIGRRFVHEIWTISSFSARALGSLGLPVSVTPCPVMLAPARQLPSRAQARQALGVDDAAFLAVSSFSLSSSLTRKNPQAAIAAMVRAFPNTGANASAVLIVRALEQDRYPAAWRALQAAAGPFGGRVRVLADPGGLERLDQLYAAGDVYVSLHRAEGFGLNLAEAMRYGLPVMCTAYSAPLEFLDDASAALVGYRRIPAVDPFGPYTVPGGEWADPDVDAASAHLVDLAAHPAKRASLAAAARTRVSTLSGGAAARALRLEPPLE